MTDFRQMSLIEELYPLHRTLVCDDIDKSLSIIANYLPRNFRSNFNVRSIPSGTQCWTWTTPQKYTVKEAYIETLDGQRIVDFADNALHLVSYSHSINEVLTFDELEKHLHYTKNRPGAIPWKFSYYKPSWGFCLSYIQFCGLDRDIHYRVVIDAEFTDDSLKVGELVIKGKSSKELLIVTNICHPYQVNDSITGVSAVIEMLHKLSGLNFEKSLRVLFLPETIGSICYFATNPEVVQNIEYGIFTEMLGNNDSLALQYSYQGDTLIDKIANAVMVGQLKEFRTGVFRTIVGNDELVTNGPGINIPTISISRSKKTLDSYPEYHTSDDKPEMLIEDNLVEAANIISDIVECFNSNYTPKRNFIGPVFLSGYGLWGVWGDIPNGKEIVDQIMYKLEGNLTVLEIALEVGLPFTETKKIIDAFFEKGLVSKQ
ncbi:MAG: DUF4910 domain-containing protein [Alteromonadaceae bacterium]|nr:DUF4910 domain-containing protein [Alteromonadaceae bacterium]